MMERQRTYYDEEYKKIIVGLYKSGVGKSELSREYGISYANVTNWINRYGENRASKHPKKEVPLTDDVWNYALTYGMTSVIKSDSKVFEGDLLKEEIAWLIRKTPMTKNEKTMVLLRYGLIFDRVLTFEEIANQFNLTRQRIEQLSKAGLKWLRRTALEKNFLASIEQFAKISKYVDALNEDKHYHKPVNPHYNDSDYSCEELLKYYSLFDDFGALEKKIMELKIKYGPYNNDEIALILGIDLLMVDEIVDKAFKMIEEHSKLTLRKNL